MNVIEQLLCTLLHIQNCQKDRCAGAVDHDVIRRRITAGGEELVIFIAYRVEHRENKAQNKDSTGPSEEVPRSPERVEIRVGKHAEYAEMQDLLDDIEDITFRPRVGTGYRRQNEYQGHPGEGECGLAVAVHGTY